MVNGIKRAALASGGLGLPAWRIGRRLGVEAIVD